MLLNFYNDNCQNDSLFFLHNRVLECSDWYKLTALTVGKLGMQLHKKTYSFNFSRQLVENIIKLLIYLLVQKQGRSGD